MSGAFGFPIFVDVRDRRVVVAGGVREAASKADALVELGAIVARWLPTDGRWEPGILASAVLAIVGTGDRVLDHRIAADARAAGVLVNTVDDPAFCDWSAPAILRRGELTVAIGTGGIAPALAVRLRDRIAADVGPEHGRLLELFAAVRARIAASGRSFAERRRLWYRLVDGPAVALLRAGDDDEARSEIEREIARWEAPA
ncbi:MAG TPA: bifunctional precorrin-2 dehydrogenase/sirohydrochlorin ferrochelatase [Candidatus Limnocylindrales bacterium]